MYPANLGFHKDQLSINKKNKLLDLKNGIYFKIVHQTWQKNFT